MTTQPRKEFRPPEDLGILSGAMGLQVVARGKGSSLAVHGEDQLLAEEKPRRLKAPRHTYNVSDATHQKAVDAADFLSGPPHREQLGKLVERAILAEVKRLEAQFNGGQPFPEATAPLRTGKRPGG